jgi:hypothetical protein
MVVEAVSPKVTAAELLPRDTERLLTTALELGADSSPSPKAIITPSAKRLVAVFIDIYFLS